MLFFFFFFHFFSFFILFFNRCFFKHGNSVLIYQLYQLIFHLTAFKCIFFYFFLFFKLTYFFAFLIELKLILFFSRELNYYFLFSSLSLLLRILSIVLTPM